MKSKLNYLKNLFGIDKDILWILINKFWSTFKGPLTIYFIIKYLSPQQQGLWYTFISLGTLSIFAELGFTIIITQFVSHEYAHLKEENGVLVGNITNIEKIISLIRFSVKFYLKIIPAAILILFIVGFFYFDMKLDMTYLAWVMYSIIGGLTLLSSLLQAIYQGLDKVKKTQVNILIGSVFMTLFNWLLLYLHYAVWALVWGNLLGLIIMCILLYNTAPKFWNQIIKFKVEHRYLWSHEIINLQWKYAISWISGFFIFYLFVPAVYKYENPVLAGQIGVTLSIISAVNGIAYAWVFSKIPKFNMLVAHKQRNGLLTLFQKSFIRSIVILLLFDLIFLVIVYGMGHYNFYEKRFLSLYFTFLLILSQVPNVIIGLLSVYLRSHKEEPYYILSLIGACLTTICTLIVLPYYGFTNFLYSLIITNVFFSLPMAVYIYLKYKNKILLLKYYTE